MTAERATAEALAEFWDRPSDDLAPWVPEGLRFEVGDRVRIVLGECKIHWEAQGLLRPDVERLNGMSGVVAFLSPGRADGHTVAVRIDTPFSSCRRGKTTVGTLCAASELVPLDGEDGR